MARLPLVAREDFPPALNAAVVRGLATRMLSSTIPVQVWAHRPDAALAWLALLDQLHNHSLLDERLRELVRLRIAGITTCQACRAARKSDRVDASDVEALTCIGADSPRFSPREQAALRYAEVFATNPHAIGDEHFAALAAVFSTAETVELQMYCALMLAGGFMTLVQQAHGEANT
ncbi:carboxymuconolactone decarboxylase family protein [Caldimonas thermodepolymerans]|uniref:carboxymuconolactone decarboxylase family protein n=1 Tax=Caldimonas thermodepolymerans TaxID=215580 RepID=UPI0022364A0F|nr:carboxymuconolactone decarboxylase family protein [Caldimonas thermodepolymerans]UZG46050.1 carboxymuconolactone decarboxylase family protein [Caldimonas thermodepolymerans]